MATQTLGKPDQPEPITDYMRRRLCNEYVALDNQQRKLRREASDKTKRMAEIAAQLEGQLRLDRTELVELPKHEFGFELVDGSFSAMGELVKEVGREEVDRRKADVPQVQKVFVREKKPAKAAAKKAATKKKSGKKPARRR